jgi:hypothetical protein
MARLRGLRHPAIEASHNAGAGAILFAEEALLVAAPIAWSHRTYPRQDAHIYYPAAKTSRN